MKRFLYIVLISISSHLPIHTHTTDILSPDYYLKDANDWVKHYFIAPLEYNYYDTKQQQTTLISPYDMNVVLNAFYFLIQALTYDQKADDALLAAWRHFQQFKQNAQILTLDGSLPSFDEHTTITTSLAAFIRYKEAAASFYQTYAHLEPYLNRAPLYELWHHFNAQHDTVGQQLLEKALNTYCSYVNQAEQETAHSLVILRDTQRYLTAVQKTIGQYTEDIAENQNKLLEHIKGNLEQVTPKYHKVDRALNAVHFENAALHRNLYLTILSAYYRILHTAMKRHTMLDRYFTIMCNEHGIIPEQDRTMYLPEPTSLL